MSASASSANMSISTSVSNSSSSKAKTMAETTAATLLRSLGSSSSSRSGSGSSPANILTSAPPRNKRLGTLSSFGKEIGSFFQQQASSAAASTLSSSGSGSGGEKSPLAIEPDISREDLMHLCLKLNKCLRNLENNFTEQKKAQNEAAAQRDELLGFVVTEVLRKGVPSEGLQISLPDLQREWAEREEERNMTLQSMQQQHRDYVQAKEQEIRLLMSTFSTSATTTPSSKPSSASTPPSTTDKHEQQQNVRQLVLEIEESRAAQVAKEKETESLRKELQEHIKALEEEKDVVISLQNQLATIKTQHETQKREEREEEEEEEEEEEGNEQQQQQQQQQHQQQQQQHKLLPPPLSPSPLLLQNEKEEKAALTLLLTLQQDLDLKTQRIATLEEQLGASSVLLHQKELTLEELRLSLSHHQQQHHELASSLQTSQYALQEALHEKETLLEQQQKANERRSQLDEVRSALSEKNGIVQRLKEDLDKAEQLRANDATQMAQLEGGAQEMMREMKALREAVKEGEGIVAGLKHDLDLCKQKAADAKTAQARAEAEQQHSKSEVEKEIWAQKEAFSLQHQQQREAHAAELTTLRRDNQKKTSLAQTLLQEKEAQLQQLTHQLTTLQADLSSGAHADSAIMILASKQSLRDTKQQAEVESFKISLKRLQEALAQKDLECAQLAAAHASLTRASVGRRQVQQREGCNLEYLKNVVVDYLSFPPGAVSEKESLERVLATLLVFTPQDQRKIKEGRERVRGGGLASWLLVPPGRPINYIAPMGRPRVAGRREGGREGGRPGAMVLTGGQQQQQQRGEPRLNAPAAGAGVGMGGGREGREAGGRTISTCLDEGEGQGGIDASVGERSSLGSSSGSVSLSSSDFESLSGHATKGGRGEEGERGGREGGVESPTQPRHVGLFLGGEEGGEGRRQRKDGIPTVSL
ncbi:hypothetical protein VYU27_001125 [Nannochloropsis oceanica]